MSQKQACQMWWRTFDIKLHSSQTKIHMRLFQWVSQSFVSWIFNLQRGTRRYVFSLFQIYRIIKNVSDVHTVWIRLVTDILIHDFECQRKVMHRNVIGCVWGMLLHISQDTSAEPVQMAALPVNSSCSPLGRWSLLHTSCTWISEGGWWRPLWVVSNRAQMQIC